MTNVLFMEGITKALLVLIFVTLALIMTRRSLFSLLNSYMLQSLLISAIAFVLYLQEKNTILLLIFMLIIISKVFIIPYIIKKADKKIKIYRDTKFHFFSPITSMLMSLLLFFLAYYAFRKLHPLINNELFFLGSIIGISLTLTGMLVVFSRKNAIIKIIGYLTMENGVVLFSLFVAELPFIIEVFIVIELTILILLAALFSFGITNSIEEFHYRLYNLLIKEDKK